jgi:hypothetical protein
MKMKTNERTSSEMIEALLVLGGYLPNLDLSLKLGREVQNEWMNSYQDIQLTNTFKVLLRRNLQLPV